MRCSIASIFALCLVVTPLYAEEQDKPEAVEMFERLIRRIPPATDAHDVHEFIGKEFTSVLPKRLARFSLSVAEDKTKLIRFGRFARRETDR